MILALTGWFGFAAGLAATLVYGVLAMGSRRMGDGTARLLLLAALLLHALSLAEGLLGQPPRFGFAPALSMTAWLVIVVYAVESRLIPQLRARWALAAVGAGAALLALTFPGNNYERIASPWLPLHWALGLGSYGLFGTAVLHAWLMGRSERAMRMASSNEPGVPLLKLERLTFRFVEAGFLLLTASLLVGWLFAEKLYGASHIQVLSHKIIFSVLAWLTFAGLLVGRARLGWRGRQARHVLYLGSGLLLLGYIGTHFVMEVLLHRL